MNGSIQSEVRLKFIHDESRQRTVLCQRRAGGLCSISKPYWDREVLGLQLVNPTAGLFSGDHLRMHVSIGDKAQVALTSPSATRYHTMPEGRATITQEFHIADHAWLDYWPEITIPQKDSDVSQLTRIHLEQEATMVFLDSLAPGRIAHGENYQFRRLETRLEIYQNDSLVAKEHTDLNPGSGKWPLEVAGWDACYYAAIWIAGGKTSQVIEDLQQNHAAFTAQSHCGTSLLTPHLGVARVISPSSLLLKKTTLQLRNLIQSHLPLMGMSFRKL